MDGSKTRANVVVSEAALKQLHPSVSKCHPRTTTVAEPHVVVLPDLEVVFLRNDDDKFIYEQT